MLHAALGSKPALSINVLPRASQLTPRIFVSHHRLTINRRDIWHGDDMAGDGALRSRWNQALLSDVIVLKMGKHTKHAKRIMRTVAAKTMTQDHTELSVQKFMK